MTIVRGTVPAELFGPHGYGRLLGRLARPAFACKAVAPVALTFVFVVDPQRRIAGLVLGACAAAALVAYLRAARRPVRRRCPAPPRNSAADGRTNRLRRPRSHHPRPLPDVLPAPRRSPATLKPRIAMRTRSDSAIRASVLPFTDEPAAVERIVQRLDRDPAAERRALLDGPARDPGVDRAEILLRCARLRAVRRDLRAAGVLPDAHRARDLHAPSQRHRERDRRGQAARRPRRRRLREGGGVAAGARAVALRRGRHRRRRAARRARAPRARAARTSTCAAWSPTSRTASTSTASSTTARDVLLPRLVDRQLRAGGRRHVPDGRPAPLPRAGQRPPDRRRHAQGRGAARGGLRRPAGRHGRVQPQRAAARQPHPRRRLRPGGFVHQRALRRGARPHRDAPRGAARDTTVHLDGVPRIFRAGERIHTENSYKYAPHDFEAILRAPASTPCARGRTTTATSPCTTRAEGRASRAARGRARTSLRSRATSSGVISGITPNHALNAGRAWFSSRPSPFTVTVAARAAPRRAAAFPAACRSGRRRSRADGRRSSAMSSGGLPVMPWFGGVGEQRDAVQHVLALLPRHRRHRRPEASAICLRACRTCG